LFNIERIKKDNIIYYVPKSLLCKNDVLVVFTGRLGGVSEPPYEFLNLSLNTGDEIKNVIKNREILCSELNLNLDRLTTCEQVHGDKVVIVDDYLIGRGASLYSCAIPKTDALITNIAEVPLAVFCADCVPIIIVDPVKQVVGAVHAGWRGTYAGIVVKTVQKFIYKFHSCPEELLFFIGPCIGSCCYGIDASLAKMFEEKFALQLDTRYGKSYLNLVEVNIKQLVENKVKLEKIYCANVCTSCSPDFFSYRKEKGLTGRHGALVAIVK